ncbi:MAG TPA: M56 family metallopeptidase [Gemmatimonadaceae bacterium]
MLVPLMIRVPVLDWASMLWRVGWPTDPATIASRVDALANAATRARLVAMVPMSFTWARVLIAIWLVGSLVVSVVSVMRVIRFHRSLRRASRPASRAEERLVTLAAGALRIRTPAVTLVDATVAPLVWWKGLSPLLVLPSALPSRLSEEELRWILMHETAHISRRDHVVRCIEWLAVVAFWWNPVAWIARRQLHAAEEMHCDELVLTHAGPEPRSYARALVHVLEFLSQSSVLSPPALALGAVTSGHTNALERRFTMIIEHTPRLPLSRGARAALWMLVALVGSIALVNVGASSASAASPRITRDECDELVTKVRAAVEAGQLSLEDGKKTIAECQRRVKLEKAAREVQQAVASGEITEAQGQEKLKALSEAAEKMNASTRVERAAMRLKKQVEAGIITEEQARAQLAELKAASANPIADDCERMKAEVAAAIKAGSPSAQLAAEKVRKVCGG